jgi:hypothetical protein
MLQRQSQSGQGHRPRHPDRAADRLDLALVGLDLAQGDVPLLDQPLMHPLAVLASARCQAAIVRSSGPNAATTAWIGQPWHSRISTVATRAVACLRRKKGVPALAAKGRPPAAQRERRARWLCTRMFPRPRWPLAGQPRFGQKWVGGSTVVLLLAWFGLHTGKDATWTRLLATCITLQWVLPMVLPVRWRKTNTAGARAKRAISRRANR